METLHDFQHTQCSSVVWAKSQLAGSSSELLLLSKLLEQCTSFKQLLLFNQCTWPTLLSSGSGLRVVLLTYGLSQQQPSTTLAPQLRGGEEVRREKVKKLML